MSHLVSRTRRKKIQLTAHSKFDSWIFIPGLAASKLSHLRKHNTISRKWFTSRQFLLVQQFLEHASWLVSFLSFCKIYILKVACRRVLTQPRCLVVHQQLSYRSRLTWKWPIAGKNWQTRENRIKDDWPKSLLLTYFPWFYFFRLG
jgi:hypothetical protein